MPKKKNVKPQKSRKPMTAEDVKAIDWASLLAKLPQFAALIAQIIQLINGPKAAKSAGAGATEGLTCCQEVKDANDDDLDLLAQYVVSRMQLSDCICCCDDDGCDDDE